MLLYQEMQIRFNSIQFDSMIRFLIFDIEMRIYQHYIIYFILVVRLFVIIISWILNTWIQLHGFMDSCMHGSQCNYMGRMLHRHTCQWISFVHGRNQTPRVWFITTMMLSRWDSTATCCVRSARLSSFLFLWSVSRRFFLRLLTRRMPHSIGSRALLEWLQQERVLVKFMLQSWSLHTRCENVDTNGRGTGNSHLISGSDQLTLLVGTLAGSYAESW